MKRNLTRTPYLVCLLLIGTLCILMTEVQDASAQILDPDLVLYFDYEDFDGNTVLEKSGRGYDGEINGNVTQSDDGKFGKAGQFAAGSFLDLDGPNVKSEDVPIEGMSLRAWINVASVSDMAIFNARATDGTWVVHPEARGDGNYRWLNRGPNPGRTIFDIRAGKNEANKWIHYGGTYSRADALAVLYINGEKVGEESSRLDTPIADNWGQGARVGFNIDNQRAFTGLMDEFNLWKRGLTAEEVNDIMNNGLGPTLTAVEAQGKLATTWGKLKAN